RYFFCTCSYINFAVCVCVCVRERERCGFYVLSLRHKDGKEKDAKRACKGWES
ncbi:unnamed protein product, partial [Musa acuminata subsp. burmannicoides]